MPRVRSPNYPSISLEKSLQLASRVHEKVGTKSFSLDNFYELTDRSKNGASASAFAALGRYQLTAEGRAGRYVLAPRAIALLQEQHTKLWHELALEAVEGSLVAGDSFQCPLEEHGLHRLGFSMQGAAKYIQVRQENVQFARIRPGQLPAMATPTGVTCSWQLAPDQVVTLRTTREPTAQDIRLLKKHIDLWEEALK